MLTATFYGNKATVMFAWLQTGYDSDETTNWIGIPTPTPASAWFSIPSGASVASVTNVLTDDPVVFSVEDRLLTIESVGEVPVAVVLS